MQGEASLVFKEIDPAKKTYEWMNKSVSILRRDWRPLVNPIRVAKNKKILLSSQDMSKVKAAFKDKEFLASTEFVPLGIWNRIVNTIVEEITKNPPKCEIKAVDPTAITKRKEDIYLLKNKKKFEEDLNAVNKGVGLPTEEIGQGEFHGNVQEFQEMGLDPEDEDDINFYKQVYQRLNFEIAGQSLINNVMRLGRFNEETIRKFVIDILSSLTASMQCYVDQMTGEIKYRYIAPEEAYGIFGDSEAGYDDLCNGYQKTMGVSEWLAAVGNEFDWNRDWRQLLWAVNYCGGTKFTGFIRNSVTYDCCGDNAWMERMNLGNASSNLIEWSNIYNYTIYAGYIEFVTPEATATYLARQGEIIPTPVSYSYDIDRPQLEGYTKESWYQNQMYKANFLVTTQMTQWIYGWGKVYMQQLYGSNDEYCRGTIMSYRMEGKSAAEISEPYIDFANITFYRMKWSVFHSKPQKEQYFLPELIKLAKGMQRLLPQNSEQAAPQIDTILKQIIQFRRENHVDIRDFPEVDGKPYPIVQPTEGARGGIDAIAVGLQAITQWCEEQIKDKAGLNDMRLGDIDNPRDGYKLTVEATKASLNSTGYVYRFIQYVKNYMATVTTLYAQDIVRFKDTVPYNWLRKLMGEEEFENLKLLEEFAAHRLGIYVTDYSAGFERNRLIAAADAALAAQDLTFGQWAMVTNTEDYKKGLKLLDFLKNKQDKKERRRAIEDVRMQQEGKKAEDERLFALEEMKGKLNLEGRHVQAAGYVEAAKIQAGSRVEVKQMTNDNEPVKQQSKADAQKQIEETKAEVKETGSLF
jgi:hypothetical protein